MSEERILALAWKLCAAVDQLVISGPNGWSLEAAHHARVIVNNLRPLLEREAILAARGEKVT